MQVDIKAPTEIEAKIAGVDKEKGVLSLTPFFYDKKASTTSATLTVTNDKGKILWSGLLLVSPKDGKPSLRQRQKAIVAPADA